MTRVFYIHPSTLVWARLMVTVICFGCFGTMAMTNLASAVEESPISPLDQAKTLLKTGESAKAIEILEELIDSLPSAAILQEAYFLHATALQQANQIPEALNIYNNCWKNFPFPQLPVLRESYSPNFPLKPKTIPRR